VDTFTRDHLPPFDQWPDLLLDRPEFQYPEYLNVAVELTDRMVEKGFGDHVALIGNGRQRTYKELTDWTNRLAHSLVEDFGVKPGNRVLIRSGNNPAMVAVWLAVTKAGAVAVNTMPLLRAGELTAIINKAEIGLALCDTRIADELVAAGRSSAFLRGVIGFDGTSNHDAELDRLALNKPVTFDAVQTGRDDVALLGFTSGTTGEPKATVHFHRDLLIIADGYAKEVLRLTPQDVFAAAGVHLWPGRSRHLPAALRRDRHSARECFAREHDRHHRDLQGDDQFHVAYGVSGHDGRDGRWRRLVIAANGDLGRRNAAGSGVRRLDEEDR
jgi:2-aminobenzoate-CoA ligase